MKGLSKNKISNQSFGKYRIKDVYFGTSKGTEPRLIHAKIAKIL
jgi:hypothetical protein